MRLASAVANSISIIRAQAIVINITPICAFLTGSLTRRAIDKTVHTNGSVNNPIDNGASNISRYQKIGTRTNAPSVVIASNINAVFNRNPMSMVLVLYVLLLFSGWIMPWPRAWNVFLNLCVIPYPRL